MLVTTVRALKNHGGVAKADLAEKNMEALRQGAGNLEKHLENLNRYGVPVVVAINEFPEDRPEEIQVVADIC